MLELFDIPNLITTYGYTGIFIIVFLESGIFFALPGDSLLFTAGILAIAGFLNLFKLIPVIFVATFLGAIVGYYIGEHIEKLRRYKFFRRILKEEHITYAHEFFEKHGKFAILISRFLPIVRTFLPIAAGISKMNYIKFINYSLVSSAIWSTTVTLAGYFLGIIFPQIKNYLHYLIFSVIFISLIPALIEFYRKYKIKKALKKLDS